VANEKIFNKKNLNNLVGTPLDSRVNIYLYIFAFKFTLKGYGAEIFIFDFLSTNELLVQPLSRYVISKILLQFEEFYVFVMPGSRSSLQCLYLRVVHKIIK
jgi:hypothetical protein